MPKETITLSHRELDRVSVIESIIAKRRRQHEAARQLGLSVRQIKRLVRRYREAGPRGLVSGQRGPTPGNTKAPVGPAGGAESGAGTLCGFWSHAGRREAGRAA